MRYHAGCVLGDYLLLLSRDALLNKKPLSHCDISVWTLHQKGGFLSSAWASNNICGEVTISRTSKSGPRAEKKKTPSFIFFITTCA